jgi:hypothetical protein
MAGTQDEREAEHAQGAGAAQVAEEMLPANAEHPAPTPWAEAQRRLAEGQWFWLATVRPDGSPHLMPVIAFWLDGAFHVLAGEGTRKGRNLAADARCVIGASSMRLPSIDIIAEGQARPIDDPDELRRITEHLAKDWPLEVRGTGLHGPHAPTAGPPPYRVYRIVPAKVFGLPGMQGMEQFQPDELPKPTRWVFGR